MRNVSSATECHEGQQPSRFSPQVKALSLVVFLSTALLSGCYTDSTTIHGFVPSDYTLDQIVEGASREQVLLTLGTPSTSANFGGEVFYYISQTRKQVAQFMNPKPVDQTVVAVYFDEDARVARTAKYGLKDGKLFDYSRQVTPTGGKDVQFLSRLMEGVGAGIPGTN
ncbi:outer membrane protein assembly factor BamE [uncultured Cohaesibacter sp.]|uniref:outer membrane protein assembly factor BamE n=1 Tax=uncultured Cohaesibacter sp. TaxID=1002546 RepID=UPI00292E43EC|nr:outer membrane protein assembly factor BamE [uncultured Cohaesibacter sp.]